MKIYFDVIKFNFLKFLMYPSEIIATVFRRLMEVVFLIMFWQIILGKSLGDMRGIVSYFLIAQSVSLIVMARRTEFGTQLRRMIKQGTINSYLIRPMKIIPYLYATTLGSQGLSIVLSLILIVAGLIINPPSQFVNIFAFFLTIIIAAGIALAFNLIEGVLAFYITETGPISSSTRRIIEVFSGAIAPLSFFPDKVRQILDLSPFPSMIYGPVTSLETGFEIRKIVVGIFWVVTLNLIVFSLWRKAIKHYEAIGM